MLDRFLHIEEYAKTQLIARIMCARRLLPKRLREYREELESMTLAEVRRERDLIANETKGEL